MRLYEPLPTSISVCGKDYKIPVDFRVWIKISKLMNEDVPIEIKMLNICLILFSGECPENFSEALIKITDFMNCGKEIKTDIKKSKAVYDFDDDAEYIYAAFYQQYGINLSTARLHWWEFKALLAGIGGDCLFTKIIEYRSTDVSKIKDKEFKKHLLEMKKTFALPDTRSNLEKEQDFADTFAMFY